MVTILDIMRAGVIQLLRKNIVINCVVNSRCSVGMWLIRLDAINRKQLTSLQGVRVYLIFFVQIAHLCLEFGRYRGQALPMGIVVHSSDAIKLNCKRFHSNEGHDKYPQYTNWKETQFHRNYFVGIWRGSKRRETRNDSVLKGFFHRTVNEKVAISSLATNKYKPVIPKYSLYIFLFVGIQLRKTTNRISCIWCVATLHTMHNLTLVYGQLNRSYWYCVPHCEYHVVIYWTLDNIYLKSICTLHLPTFIQKRR